MLYFGYVEQLKPDEGGIEGEHDFISEPYAQALFPGGSTKATFDVGMVDDAILEGSERFNISIDPLSLPYGVVLGDTTIATVEILDNESK